MPRDYRCNGETLVVVRFGDHISGEISPDTYPLRFFSSTDANTLSGRAVVIGPFDEVGDFEFEAEPDFSVTYPSMYELGLASEAITISPKFYHRDIRVDDFGPDVPAEVMWNLAEVQIRMKLIHFDETILRSCVQESMGGGRSLNAPEGLLAPTGSMLGRGKPIFSSGNHFISVSLLSPQMRQPWHFPTAHLAIQPIEYPLGTSVSVVDLMWRAIPYVPLFSDTTNSGRQPTEICTNGPHIPTLWNRNPANITDADVLRQLFAL